MIPLHTPHAIRTLAYLRWLRMNTHWWHYFNASARNLLKYERMRTSLLSEHHWYSSFPSHFHYDVSLDEFYRFLEQVLDEFQIPKAILSDFRCYTRQTNEHRKSPHFRPTQPPFIHKTQGAVILRI